MKRKIWPIIVGITGAGISSLLWIILQKSRNTHSTRSNKTSSIQQQKSVLQEATTILPVRSKQTLDNNGKQSKDDTHSKRKKGRKKISVPTFLITFRRRILPGSLIFISVILFVTWSIALIINLLIEPLPNGFMNDQTVPTIDNPLLPPDGVSILPVGRLGSNEPHATLTFTISQIKNVTPSEATLTGTFDLTVPRELQTKICDSTGLTRQQEILENKCEGKGLVAQQTRDQGIQLKSQYVSESLNLSIYDYFGLNSYSKVIPLRDLFLPPPSSSILNTLKAYPKTRREVVR